MKHLKRGITLFIVLFLALTMLLAACGSIVSSITSTSTPTPPTTTITKGEFIGDASQQASIGFSTDGKQILAYLCDGTDKHVSLAEWLRGSVNNNGINITDTHGSHLVATLSAQAIKGTVTLKSGQTISFNARLIPHPSSQYGLFRSEQTFHGVHYLGGWIIRPEGFAGTSAGGTTFLAGALMPSIVCCNPIGGIINEQTGALIVSPVPDVITSVTVPNLGTFPLTPCRQGLC